MKLANLLMVCSIFTLAACSGNTVKETLGVNRDGPDEFRVVSRPPLYVPPQFNLRPPSTEAASPIVVPADKQAQSLITGGKQVDGGEVFSLKQGSADTAVAPVSSSPLAKNSAEKRSAGEQKLLENIGAAKADPKVRDELVRQQAIKEEKQEEASWWDFFHETREKKDPLVNANEESKRIKTNQAEGRPVTEGETPEVKDKDRGWFREWLGW